VWYGIGVGPVLTILLVLALPWVWGAIVSAVYSRMDRKGPDLRREQPPTDYSI